MKYSKHRFLSFFAIPILLLPFFLAVFFEEKTDAFPDGIAYFFFFYGRIIFPLAYMHKKYSTYLVPIVQSSTHLWDVLAWIAISIMHGVSTFRMRARYAVTIAPVVVVIVVVGFHALAWQIDYVFWARPFRVTGPD